MPLVLCHIFSARASQNSHQNLAYSVHYSVQTWDQRCVRSWLSMKCRNRVPLATCRNSRRHEAGVQKSKCIWSERGKFTDAFILSRFEIPQLADELFPCPRQLSAELRARWRRCFDHFLSSPRSLRPRGSCGDCGTSTTRPTSAGILGWSGGLWWWPFVSAPCLMPPTLRTPK